MAKEGQGYPCCQHDMMMMMIFQYSPAGLVSRVFANGPGDLSSIPGHLIPKSLKMVLDTSLLNT